MSTGFEIEWVNDDAGNRVGLLRLVDNHDAASAKAQAIEEGTKAKVEGYMACVTNVDVYIPNTGLRVGDYLVYVQGADGNYHPATSLPDVEALRMADRFHSRLMLWNPFDPQRRADAWIPVRPGNPPICCTPPGGFMIQCPMPPFTPCETETIISFRRAPSVAG